MRKNNILKTIAILIVLIAILCLVVIGMKDKTVNNEKPDIITDITVSNGDVTPDSVDIPSNNDESIEENVVETIASSHNVDYSTIEKLLNNESLVDYFKPEYSYTFVIDSDENGEYIEQHYTVVDNITSGQFNNLYIDLIFGENTEVPLVLNMSLNCENNLQAYTKLLTDLEYSMQSLYGDSIVGKLSIGNVSETINIQGNSYIISQSTSTNSDNSFIINYNIVKENLNKNYIDIYNFDYSIYKIDNLIYCVDTSYINDNSFISRLAGAFNISILSEESNAEELIKLNPKDYYKIKSINSFDTLNETLNTIELEINGSNLVIEAVKNKEDKQLNRYKIVVNKKDSIKNLKVLSKDICNIILGYDISDIEFIEDKDNKKHTIENDNIILIVSNNTIEIYDKTYEAWIQQVNSEDNHIIENETIDDKIYDDNGNEIPSNELGNPNEMDSMYN